MPLLVPVETPNLGTEVIPVEFLLLHYTACDAARALRIFTDPARGLCAQFVLDTDGKIYDLGGSLAGPVRLGAHAGKSRWDDGSRVWEAFNKFSVGVEIVNLNGNILDYTNEQYLSLGWLARELQSRHPALRDPRRVVGHEQIAGFRGKADPGARFDWARFFTLAYPGLPAPERHCVATADEIASLSKRARDLDPGDEEAWSRLSSDLETRVAARQ